MAAGHRIDDPLVEEIGDDDPDQCRAGRPWERELEVSPRKAKVLIDRKVLVLEDLDENRPREDDHVDQQEQPGHQQDRTRLVRCDVGVETVSGHGPAVLSSELHTWRLLELAASLAEVEEFLAAETERGGEQGGGKLLDAG